MTLSPAAIGIILNSDNTEVLLVKRKDVPIWVLPGGGVESNETPEEAVVREIREETGLQVYIKRKCAEYTSVNRLSAFTSVFICYISQGTLELSEETSGIQFFPLCQLPSFFFELHRTWLKEALTSSTLIRKPLASVTYWFAIKCFLRHPYYTVRYLLTRLMN